MGVCIPHSFLCYSKETFYSILHLAFFTQQNREFFPVSVETILILFYNCICFHYVAS